MGIEPTALAWEARVLPLYDARMFVILTSFNRSKYVTVSCNRHRVVHFAGTFQMKFLLRIVFDRRSVSHGAVQECLRMKTVMSDKRYNSFVSQLY